MKTPMPFTWNLRLLTFCHILFLCLFLHTPTFLKTLFENKLQTQCHLHNAYFGIHLLSWKDFLILNHKTIIILKKRCRNSTILFNAQLI